MVKRGVGKGGINALLYGPFPKQGARVSVAHEPKPFYDLPQYFVRSKGSIPIRACEIFRRPVADIAVTLGRHISKP